MRELNLVILFIFFIVLLLFLTNRNSNIKVENALTFKEKLSDYHLFEGKMAGLIPVNQAEIYELSSPLFTDYSEKQRLILVPEHKKIKTIGDNLLDFPDGTIIAKTFYYKNRIQNKQLVNYIIETRLLIKHKSIWNTAVYKWNDNQNEAYLLKNGSSVPITFIDDNAVSRSTNYKIPSQTDCISCHAQNGKNVPIGPKLSNLNINVKRDDLIVNQLEYLQQKNKLEFSPEIKSTTIANYKDQSLSLEKRTRAYLDINCAHCHNPSGSAFNSNLDLRNETPIKQTGIHSKKGEISFRISTTGELHMPKTGTTMKYDEGVQLVLNYLKNLN